MQPQAVISQPRQELEDSDGIPDLVSVYESYTTIETTIEEGEAVKMKYNRDVLALGDGEGSDWYRTLCCVRGCWAVVKKK